MIETTSPSLADEIQRQTYELVHYIGICDRFCVQELGVTASQGYILLALPEMDIITMNDLSLKMRLANSTMTRMVDQLVQKGMVVRETYNQDRRIVHVRLTAQGYDVKTRLKNTLQDFFTQVLGNLPENRKGEIVEGLEVLNQSIVKTLNACCGSELAD